MFYNDVSLLYQKMKIILWSIHTLWYKGSAPNKEKRQGRKMSLSLKNSSPESKADFSKK